MPAGLACPSPNLRPDIESPDALRKEVCVCERKRRRRRRRRRRRKVYWEEERRRRRRRGGKKVDPTDEEV